MHFREERMKYQKLLNISEITIRVPLGGEEITPLARMLPPFVPPPPSPLTMFLK